MIKYFLIPSLLLLASCQESGSFKKAEDAQDAGREFIRAALDGNYEKVSFYLYPDSINRMLLDKWKKDYDAKTREEQQKYRDANIMPIDIHTINDSVTKYTYANSYKHDTITIKVVRVNGNWLVDLKEILINDKE
jgi:hypothetical protein